VTVGGKDVTSRLDERLYAEVVALEAAIVAQVDLDTMLVELRRRIHDRRRGVMGCSGQAVWSARATGR
jgi:hypothetical protein